MAKPTKNATLICLVLSAVAAAGIVLGFVTEEIMWPIGLLVPTVAYEAYRTEGASTRWASWTLAALMVALIVVVLFDIDYDQWRRALTVNLDSQFLMAKGFLPDMVDRGWGRVVNVASSSLLTNTPGLVSYMASKGGVLGFTSALANDVGQYGVTVNAVSPGLTRTPGVEEDIAAGIVPADAPESVVPLQAIKRPGTPGDLVGAVLFLTSDDAAFMTGQFLVVDGGMTRR